MGITHYLAMTAAELRNAPTLPPALGWMGCHFSPYGLGLSNFPQKLPPGSLLILDDITPIHGHDPERISAQLADTVEKLECAGVLLDFQRPGYEESAALAKHLAGTLPCPVAVSERYIQETDAAVFLPPVPCNVPLREYLAPWEGRGIWLEAALEGEVITLTEEGASFSALPRPAPTAEGFAEETLHCHYTIEVMESEVKFTLWRTREDLDALFKEAETLGVTHAVGLYQEFAGLNV